MKFLNNQLIFLNMKFQQSEHPRTSWLIIPSTIEEEVINSSRDH